MLRCASLALIVLCAFNLNAGASGNAGPDESRNLSFEDRLSAQTAIEEVFWAHRIWPEVNPGPKPPLEEVMPESAIRAKVEDYLRMSNALDRTWRRPVRAEQLQAEIDRMVGDTRQPGMLRELFEALENDPHLIAECLARQVLVERLSRNWYAGDERFGGSSGESFDQWWSGESKRFGVEIDAPDSSYSVGSPEDADCTEGEWTPTSYEPPGRMTEHIAVWTGSEMLVWGGSVNYTDTSGGYRYDPATDVWTTIPVVEDTPRSRTGHTAVWTGTELIVWGGISADGPTNNKLNSGGRYNPSSGTWTATSTDVDVPQPRDKHTAVWTGSEMIVWGGTADLANSGARYDPVTDSWTPTARSTANVPLPRHSHTAVWNGSVMIIWGGWHAFGPLLNSGGRYDPATDSWLATEDTGNCPTPRAYHTAVWTGSEMIVWGGSGTNSGGRYDPGTDSWLPTSTGTNVPAGRGGHTAVWTGSNMVVWGGGTGSGLNTGGRYDPVADSWLPTTFVNAPTKRVNHTAIWSGAEMIVWGGGTDGQEERTGSRYDPVTDSWISTSAGSGAPGERVNHTAVWTGSEMIVWGGQQPGLLDSGSRYTPATDSWTPTGEGDGLPQRRLGHVAVWTGYEMIVWGGRNTDSIRFGDGGRYNPGTDTWRGISTTSAPSPRADHTMVWTGTEAIVWGGEEHGGEYFNDGGRYDPYLDIWNPTSTGPSCPSQRHRHSAVWTGNEIIVWGGQFRNIQLQDGGRYDPSTDSWSLTGTGANLPEARRDHSAVWTGTEMIVWGGDKREGAYGDYLDTGGRYDPVTDGWAPTGTGPDTPQPRSDHSTVWTGTVMTVWGGKGLDFEPLHDGGSYDPVTDTWTATGMGPGVPDPRHDHTAVRTLDSMIVWGGNPLTSSGGIYCDLPCTAQTWYADSDEDDYGDPDSTASSCTQPSGYIARSGDCDDTDAAIHPLGTETCDGVDEDCDGEIDNGFDGDLDGWTTCAGDCDDTNGWIYPGAPERCDHKNNDCNHPDWPELPEEELDQDEDGWRVCDGDCDDHDYDVNPWAVEVCNGEDDNCNDLVDDDAWGEDWDTDGVHNVCDNCWDDWNPTQSDTDADTVGDMCDLDDGTIYLFWVNKDSQQWHEESGYDSWNSYKGDLDVLKSTGEYTQAPGSNDLAARQCGSLSPGMEDLVPPDPEMTAYFLVTGMAGGVESGLGTDSGGTPRPNDNPCP